MKEYTNFSAEDLLDDDFFILSHTTRSHEFHLFWESRLLAGKVNRKEYERACYILSSFHVRKETIPADIQKKLWSRIVQTNCRKRKNRQILTAILISTAASLLALLISNLPGLYHQETTNDFAYLLSQTDLPAGGKEIQLILPEKSIAIPGQNSLIRYDQTGSVVIDSGKVKELRNEPEGVYSQLLVPNGKRSTLILEDGTKIWINAGSRVIYPGKFEKNKREIYVDGEIYLEVAREKKRPFVVKTHTFDVEVLGTTFNVTAYQQDTISSVVLASGSVRVGTKDKKIKLVPNEMYAYHPQKGGEIKEVTVSDYISWKDGIYIYQSERLSSILTRIARYYGREIEYDEEIARFTCSGKLDLQDDLDSLLEGLTQTAPVDFIKQDGKYIFKKKKIE